MPIGGAALSPIRQNNSPWELVMRQGGKMINLVAQLRGIDYHPKQDDRVDYEPDGRTLRGDQ
jgi:hypothetical protein